MTGRECEVHAKYLSSAVLALLQTYRCVFTILGIDLTPATGGLRRTEFKQTASRSDEWKTEENSHKWSHAESAEWHFWAW